jgi:hypothetical protein
VTADPTRQTAPKRRAHALNHARKQNARARRLVSLLCREDRRFYDDPRHVWDGSQRAREFTAADWQDIADRARGIAVQWGRLGNYAQSCAEQQVTP